MIIKTGFGKDQETYFATERISDMGVAYRLTKAGTMQFYDVLPADVETGYSECSCPGHIYTGKCKHVKALREMLGIGKDGRSITKHKILGLVTHAKNSKYLSGTKSADVVIARPVLSPISMESVTRPYSSASSYQSYAPRKQRSAKQIAASEKWLARMNGGGDKIHGYDDGEAEPQSRGIHRG